MAERVKGISTHVLDTSRGKPACGIRVTLEVQHENTWTLLNVDVTDQDGRCLQLLGDYPLVTADYRITFATAPYFQAQSIVVFYPIVTVTFAAQDLESHYHVPLLLGPNSYTTYRGS